MSWLLLAIGAGALIGPFLLPRRCGARPAPLFWAYVWRGVGDVLLALLTPFPVALVLLFTYGLGTSTGAVTFSTVVQQRTPDRLRGRVFATLDAVWATGEIASIGLAGLFVDRAGIVAVYLGGDALLALAGALGLVASARRERSGGRTDRAGGQRHRSSRWPARFSSGAGTGGVRIRAAPILRGDSGR